jgi:hypothetical protein
MIVRETVSHVPHDDDPPHDPLLHPPESQPLLHEPPPHEPLSHELAPQGLQLEAHGAEQHRLTRWRQWPASTDEAMATNAAKDKNKRIRCNPPKGNLSQTVNTRTSNTPSDSESRKQSAILPKIAHRKIQPILTRRNNLFIVLEKNIKNCRKHTKHSATRPKSRNWRCIKKLILFSGYSDEAESVLWVACVHNEFVADF